VRTETVRVRSAGCLVQIESEVPATSRALADATGGATLAATAAPSAPDVLLTIERSRRPFDIAGMRPVTRGCWSDAGGRTVIENVGGSGFSQLWHAGGDSLEIRTRWMPTVLGNVAARTMPTRFRLLRAQVLLHYPILWWSMVTASTAPVHVSAVELHGVGVVLAGPGGVGKSTLVAAELAAGHTATCDNLAVTDGHVVHGVNEALRLPRQAEALGRSAYGSPQPGARATHGRTEHTWPRRAEDVVPAMVVVVRRGGLRAPTALPADAACRALVAGTYAAGELRRYWPLVATLALATGRGPAHPAVEEVAATLTGNLPCYELDLGTEPGPRLGELLAEPLSLLGREPTA
jgi:hypothetical protein